MVVDVGSAKEHMRSSFRSPLAWVGGLQLSEVRRRTFDCKARAGSAGDAPLGGFSGCFSHVFDTFRILSGLSADQRVPEPLTGAAREGTLAVQQPFE